MITIDDFAKVELRVGLVTEASNKEGSEKLIKLTVSFGEDPPAAPDAQHLRAGSRTIFTGVRTFGYTPEDFINKKFLFVTNLEYRKMIDEESQGMILAVDLPAGQAGSPEGKPVFVSAENLPVGAKVR